MNRLPQNLNHAPPGVSLVRKKVAFSLIEVLVVITLLSIVVLALMDVFSSTQRAFRAAVTQSDVLEGSRAAMDLITSDLRTMTPSYGVYGGSVNFLNLDNNYNAATPYTPLPQTLPGSSNSRYNLLQYFFVLGRQNTQWTAVGYVVNVTNTSTLFPLYRFSASTNATQSPLKLLQLFQNTIASGGWTNNCMSHVMDGVVHLVVRPYDLNGVWLTNGYTFGMKPPTNAVSFSSPVYGEVSTYFYSNAIPASVEVQMAVIEDRALQRAESYMSLPVVGYANMTNYLAAQAGAVHVFRQIVTIPNVDRTAYQ